MGASDFRTTATGKTAEEAYRAACEDARADRRANRDDDDDGGDGGDDSYSGDIQTTRGFVVVDVPKGTRDAGRNKIIESIIDNDGNRYGITKWGKAGCIELGREKGMPRGQRAFLFFGWGAS